jgi:hypothetical protein
MFQGNCIALEIAGYWQWTVFGVARRTANQGAMPLYCSYAILLYCVLCHMVSVITAFLKADSGQLYLMSIMAITSWIVTWVGYCILAKQVNEVLAAQKRSNMHVDSRPVLAALRRVKLMVGWISCVMFASIFITVLDALPPEILDKRVVPILFVIAWINSTIVMSLFGWVAMPIRVPVCMLRWCCPRACVHAWQQSAVMVRYRSVHVATPLGAVQGSSRHSSGHKRELKSRMASQGQLLSQGTGGGSTAPPQFVGSTALTLHPSQQQLQLQQQMTTVQQHRQSPSPLHQPQLSSGVVLVSPHSANSSNSQAMPIGNLVYLFFFSFVHVL